MDKKDKNKANEAEEAATPDESSTPSELKGRTHDDNNGDSGLASSSPGGENGGSSSLDGAHSQSAGKKSMRDRSWYWKVPHYNRRSSGK